MQRTRSCAKSATASRSSSANGPSAGAATASGGRVGLQVRAGRARRVDSLARAARTLALIAKETLMLGAIITLLLVAAAAYAVTQVGGVITLLFIAAVLVLAYRRLSLLTFTATFTVLLVAYTWLGERSVPAGIWMGFLWLLLASLWLLNVRPLAQGDHHPAVHEGVPEAAALDVADRAGGAGGGDGVVGR